MGTPELPRALPDANGPAVVALPEPVRPLWDARQRELWLGEQLVKRFRTLAHVQELILATFERCGWPSQIPAPPFPGRSKQTRQDRLHDAIKALNGHQREARIYFYRDGTGQGIGWELTPTRAKPARKAE